MSDASETIQLTGQFSWRDYQHVNRLVVSLRQRMVLHGVVLLLVFFGICLFRLRAPLGPIAFAGFVVTYFVMLSRLQRHSFVKEQTNRGRVRIEIDGGGVTVYGADRETRFTWNAFGSVTRDNQFIVLRGRERGRLPVVILPKSWCSTTADWTQVEEFVATRLPSVASVYSTKEARRVRFEHLSAESALKRSVFLLLALWLVITLVAFVVPFQEMPGHASWYVVFFRVQSALVTAVCALTAWQVSRFAAGSRLPLQVLAALCLPLFPLGTVLGLRILYLLTTGPEPHLLTSAYEQIVRMAGPMELQKSNRMRPFVWFVIALVVLIIILAALISQVPEEIRYNL